MKPHNQPETSLESMQGVGLPYHQEAELGPLSLDTESLALEWWAISRL